MPTNDEYTTKPHYIHFSYCEMASFSHHFDLVYVCVLTDFFLRNVMLNRLKRFKVCRLELELR